MSGSAYEVFARMGYEGQARAIQDAYLAGDKKAAMRRSPRGEGDGPGSVIPARVTRDRAVKDGNRGYTSVMAPGSRDAAATAAAAASYPCSWRCRTIRG